MKEHFQKKLLHLQPIFIFIIKLKGNEKTIRT